MRDGNSEPIILKDIQAKITIPNTTPTSPIQFTLSGNTSQGQLTGGFEIDGHLKGFQSYEGIRFARGKNGVFKITSEDELFVKAKITNFLGYLTLHSKKCLNDRPKQL